MSSKIIIAVTGSIAAYKSCDLVRNLTKAGYPVQVIMTENATKFIGKLTFEALSGNKVYFNEFENGMLHIDLKNYAKVFAIVPATANTIAKLANGIADDLISTTYLSVTCPVIVAPAMNPGMYAHNATKRNLELLRKDGVQIMDPANGIVVCGDEGKGKLANVELIQEAIEEEYNK